MTVRTESEKLFESACTKFGIRFSRIPEETTPTPDYEIWLGDNLVIAEVAQLDDNEDDKEFMRTLRERDVAADFIDSVSRIKRKIQKKNARLKYRTRDKHPGICVLYSNTFAGAYDAEDVHEAMFGSEIHTYAVEQQQRSEPVYMGSRLEGGEMHADKHTTTSAVVALISTPEVRLHFYHNKFAALPISAEWIRVDGVTHHESSGGSDSLWMAV